jgi:mannan endo-1,4-beta-mannosidase
VEHGEDAALGGRYGDSGGGEVTARWLMLAVWLAAGAAACAAQAVRVEAEDAKLEGPSLAVVRPADAVVAPDAAVKADAAVAADMPAVRPTVRTGYSGTGYVTGFTAQSSRLVFDVEAPVAGAYELRVGYACPQKKGYSVQVNGLKMSGTFAPTPGLGFGVQSLGRVELQQGANTVAVGRGWGFFDVDYIEVVPSGPVPALVKPPAVTSDPDATPAAKALLARLVDVYGRGTLLGVYSDRDAKFVLDTTGFRPAIMGGELSHYSPAGLEHDPKPEHETERLIARASDGYAITISWHWIAPYGLLDTMLPGRNGGPPVDARWYKGFYTNATTFDLAAAMADPESKEYKALLRDIDAIAVQLKKLDAAGVPVLWRPLHEAEGGWFWWGAKGPKPLVALWRLMYDRLVNVDGVHNLIWVYTSGGDMAWYPGDAYVDVVGIDAYPDDIHDPQLGLWDSLLKEFSGRKLLAVSEFGGVPDIERMQRLGAEWVYAVSWSGDLGPRKNGAEELRRIYSFDGALKMVAPEVKPVPGQVVVLPETEE